jgi:hypothetical protein
VKRRYRMGDTASLELIEHLRLISKPAGTRICNTCGHPFTVFHKSRHTTCLDCRAHAHAKKQYARRECKMCGDTFLCHKQNRARICSVCKGEKLGRAPEEFLAGIMVNDRRRVGAGRRVSGTHESEIHSFIFGAQV